MSLPRKRAYPALELDAPRKRQRTLAECIAHHAPSTQRSGTRVQRAHAPMLTTEQRDEFFGNLHNLL